MTRIYTDTNVLRYFGTAFAKVGLADELRDRLLLSPLVVMELLSQLGTDAAAEALVALQAFPRAHDAKASGMLPWSDDLFRICLFGLSPHKDVITPALNNAVIRALNATSPEELRVHGEELRALMDAGKEETAGQFSEVLKAWRSEKAPPEEEHQKIFAHSIARRARIDEAKLDVKFVVDNLNALYIFEKTKIQVAAEHPQYNVDKHSNDVYDAELLIYLADPTLHLLTSDKGFRRVSSSSQYNRVHIVEADCLRDAACAEQAIRAITGVGS